MMLIRNLFLLSLVGLAIAIPFDTALGEGKISLRSNTDSSNPTGENETASPLVEKPIPDTYSVFLKHTSKVSPEEHAAWATTLQRESKTNPKGHKGVPDGAGPIRNCFGPPPSGIYWAKMGNATVKQVRDDPSVSSVNAVGYKGENESLMEAFSPIHEYMVIMDPRSGMDVWTHANITKRWIAKNELKDDGLFEGATSFYNNSMKWYAGWFDPETAKKIENDENVDQMGPGAYTMSRMEFE